MDERRDRSRILLFALLVFLLTACGQDSSSNNSMNYKEMKSMVVDILKTEEAQDAIHEAQQTKKGDDSHLIHMLSSPEGEKMQYAVKEVLTHPDYHKHLQMLMTDPKFAGEFAKVVQEENKQIHKELMKDPEYQSMLIDTFNEQEFKEIIFELMKSKDYREQTMNIMRESMANPIFKLELLELMKVALQDTQKPNFEEAGTPKQNEDEKKKEEADKEKEKKENEHKKESEKTNDEGEE